MLILSATSYDGRHKLQSSAADKPGVNRLVRSLCATSLHHSLNYHVSIEDKSTGEVFMAKVNSGVVRGSVG